MTGRRSRSRGAKPRQLLVLLAMRPNRPVPAEELIEELWEGEPPPSAATAFRVHVGRLRQVLELDRDPSAPSGRLPAGPHGYLLRVEPDELDVQRFERLIVLAREADAVRGARGRGATPDRGARPVAGPGTGRRPGSRVRPARRSRGSRSCGSSRSRSWPRFGSRSASTRWSSTHSPPRSRSIRLRERLTEGLMRALYRSDRQADALRVYAELAHRLDDELGLAPSARLRRLEEDVLLQRSDTRLRRAAQPVDRDAAARLVECPVHRSAPRAPPARRALRRGALRSAAVRARRRTARDRQDDTGRGVLHRGSAARARRRSSATATRIRPATTSPSPRSCARSCDGSTTPARAELPPVLRLVLARTRREPALRASVALDANAPGAHLQLFEAIATTLERLGRGADRARHRGHPLGRPADARAPALSPALSPARPAAGRGDVPRRRVHRRTGRTDRAPRAAREHDDDAARGIRRLRGAGPHPFGGAARDDVGDHRRVGSAARHHGRQSVLPPRAPAGARRGAGEARRRAATSRGRWRRSRPPGVRTLVDRRLERLTDRGREVLESAAVLGRDVSIDLLASMCGVPSDVVFDALEESLARPAARRGLRRRRAVPVPAHAHAQRGVRRDRPRRAHGVAPACG